MIFHTSQDGVEIKIEEMIAKAAEHHLVFLECHSGNHRAWCLSRIGESWLPHLGLGHGKANFQNYYYLIYLRLYSKFGPSLK